MPRVAQYAFLYAANCVYADRAIACFLSSVSLGTLFIYLFIGWLVVLGLSGPKRQYFSLYRAVSQRDREREREREKERERERARGGRERREKIEKSKNVKTSPTRTYCKCNRSLHYYHPNCRTPRYWKFTQDHRTTRPLLIYLFIYFYFYFF